MEEKSVPAQVAGFSNMAATITRSAKSHPRQMVDMTLKVWEEIALPALRKELAVDGDAAAERDRIRQELRRPCGQALPLAFRSEGVNWCRMNKGHIGGCSPWMGRVTVTLDRLEEILDG